MIKKLLGLLLFFSIGSCVFATHIVGGNLAYEYMGKVGTNYRYKITFQTFLDCNSPFWLAGFPETSLNIGVYQGTSSPSSNLPFVTSVTLPLIDSSSIVPIPANGCTVGGSVCMYQATYQGTVDLPLSFQGYHLFYDRCCRNGSTVNLLNPGNQGLAFHAYIAPSLVNNSSPVFTDVPVPFLCVNDTVSLLNSAIDPDGDQLIFSFVNPYQGFGTSGNPAPPLPSPLTWPIPPVTWANATYNQNTPFGTGGYAFINGSTGLTQYMSPNIGAYVVAVEIREFRNNNLIGITRRDIQILVINCPPNPPPNLAATGGSGTTQYTIAECDNLNFPITFTDANGDSLTLSSGGQLFNPSFVNPPATIDSLVLGDSTVTASFNWQPSCGTAQALPYLFNVSATDNGCPPKTTNVIYEITITPHTPPTSINGLYLVCANTTTTYTTNVVPNSTYNWTVTGGVINSGQGTTSISVTWGNAGTGTVFVNSVSTCGCPSVIIDTSVTILATPVANAGSDKIICLGDTVQIGGSPTGPVGATYNWSPATNINNTAASNPLVWPTISTNYIVTVDNGVCSSKDTVLVTVGSISINAGNDTTICLGSSVQLNATGGTIYSWTPTTGLSNPNIANPIATPLTTTTYQVTVTDALGCSGTDTVKVTVTNPPTVSLNNDTTICLGSCVQLTASGGTTYQWSPTTGLSNPNISNPIACPLATTTYIVTVTNAVNCVSVDSVKITINPSPIIKSNNDTAICIGNCVQLSTTGGVSYSWLPITGLSNPAIGNPLACPIVTTNYVVTGTDLNGCTAKDTVVITINPLPVVSAGPDKSVCITGSVVIGGAPSGPAGSTFSWTPAATLNNAALANPTATPLVTTTYILTVVNTNGCTKKDTVIVTVNPLPIVNAGNDTSICSGTSVTIGGSPTSPSASPTYSWTPAASLNNPNIANPIATPTSSPTSYIVTVTDINSCVKRDTVIVSLNPTPIIKSNNDTAICIGNCAQLNTTGGVSYSWLPITGLSNPAIGNPLACPIVTTNYVVTGTDLNGCTAKDTVVITINPLPVVSAGPDLWLCIGDDVQLNATGGTSYLWTPSLGLNDTTIANPIANPLSSTTYIVTGFDNNGCSSADTMILTVNNIVPISIGNDTTICVGDSVQLGGNPTSPIGTTYSWTPIASLDNPTSPNPIAFPTVTTTYYLTATNDTCSSIDSVTIIVHPLTPANAGVDVSICIGDTTQLSASGGISYVWQPANLVSNSLIFNPLAFPTTTTDFIVNVTDNNGCNASDTVTISVNLLPIVNAGVDTSFCIGGSVQLNATGATSYIWSPSTGLSSTVIANPVANPIVSTVYTVVGTDGNTCSNTDAVLVTVNPLPTITAFSDTAICIGASVQLNATGGTSYNWTPATTLSNPNIANPIATPLVTTTYIVNALDGNSCANADTITVTVNNLPTINAGSDVAICFGDTTQLLASGGNSYVWSPIAGLSSSTVANPLAFPTITTSYIVNGTDNNLCVNKDTVVVTVNQLPIVNAGADTSFCIGGSVQLTASGATSYIWSPSTGLSSTVIANPVANPIVSTVYTVTGTDGNTCSNTDAVLVTVNPLPTITAFSDTAICIGASVQLNATGGTSYSWTPAATLSNPNIANPVATPLVTTTYIVNALDGNSCANADTITVTVNNLPTISAGSDVAICFGDTTQLLASGGNSYVWSPITGLSSSTIANPLAFPTSTTSYIVNGTDNNLCVNKDTVVVTVNPLPNINIGISDTVYLCLGDSTQLIASGGISYQWTPNTFISNTSVFNPYVYPPNTTTYTVIGTDANSCKNTDQILVSVFTIPTLSDTTICIGDSLQLNVSGPINATYTWSPTTNLSNPNIANPYTNTTTTITYTVIVQNVSGCMDTSSITITAVDKPTADFTIESLLSCDGILVNFNNQSLFGNTYLWNFGDGQQSTLVNPSHVFNYGTSIITILTATSINGCTDSYSLPIINGNFEDLFNLTPATVFTPNRDGFNDLFRLDLPKDMGTCTNVQIFNRWGMLVFEAINQNIGWDGRTTTGTEVPAGTYFYIVEVNGIVKKGALTLFR
jgi:gliding motility-associated-like protein